MLKRILSMLLAFTLAGSMLISGAAGAFAAENTEISYKNTEYITLQQDLDGLTLTQDTVLDLNGYSLTNVVIPEGVTVQCLDSATDDYEGPFGTLSGTVEGIIAPTYKTQTGNIKSYVTVCENGVYSFHRYYVSIAAISLQPAKAGLGYRAEFRGDETLKNALVEYGYELWVNDNAHKTYTRTDKLEKSSMTLRISHMLAQGDDARNAIGSAAAVNGNAFMTLNLNGQNITLSSTQQSTTLRQVIETINANVGKYGEAQLEAVRSLCTTYSAWMLGWNTANIFSGEAGEGAEGELKVEITVDVNAENNILSQDAQLSYGDISAAVPAGAVLEEGTTQLVLTITEKASSDSDVAKGEGESLTPLDIHIQGISPENAAPIVICLGAVLPKGLNIGNYSLYHVESQGSVQMSRVYALSELDAHNEFYYDPATGFVTVSMASFSEVALLIDDVPVWEGEVEAFKSGSGEENDPWIIANADQLAYMSQMVSNSEDYADDYYKLISDVDFGGYSNTVDENDVPTNVFYPIGYWKLQDGTNAAGEPYYGFGNAFRGVFDGNGNTVANLCQRTWDMDGNYDNGYWDDAMGLFGACFDATIKNLTMDNFQSDGEFTVTGCVAAFAGGEMLFENIYLTNCNPRVYNTGNGGIVGMNYNSSSGTPDNITFRNITVDQTNKITALWGSYDVGCGGIMGRLRDNAANGEAVNNTVHFENCHVAAIIDVYNDVCANYQYYQYRYCGMMIGTVDYIDMADYGVAGLDKVISAKDCTVTYGNWNEYWYCELVANSLASYTHDHQFSRLEKISSIDEISADNGLTWKKSGNFVIPATNEEEAVCYHIVNKDGVLTQHKHEDEGTQIINGKEILVEDRQHYYIPFGQLFTGYGWGSTAVRTVLDDQGQPLYENIDIEILDGQGSTVKAQQKFTAQDISSWPSGTPISVGALFEESGNGSISPSTVQVYVSPADETSTVSAVYTANPLDWDQGTLTFHGTGSAKIVITDYFYCTPTTLYITVECGHENAYAVEGQEPTCKEIGYTAGTYCDVCQDYATGHDIVAPLGHDWVDDVCTGCDMIRVWTGMTYDANAGQAFELKHAKLEGTKATVTVVGTNGQVITLANATLENGKLTIPAASMANAYLPTGNVEIEVENEAGQGYLLADVQITWVIHSWSELAVMERHLVANGDSYIGSVALGADFNMEKAVIANWLWKKINTFNGTFDGRGYTITGVNAKTGLKGIFVNVGAEGIVKNLRIENAVISSYSAPVVGYQLHGTLENIYVQGSVIADGMKVDSELSNFGSGLLAGQIYADAKIRNVIVDAQIADGLELPAAIGRLRSGVKEADVFTNCYAVVQQGYTLMKSGNVRADFATEGNKSFMTMWQLWQNETAKALAQQLNVPAPTEPATVALTMDGSFDMNTTQDLIYTNEAMNGKLLGVTVKGTDLVLANATLENGVLTIPAASFKLATIPCGTLTLQAYMGDTIYEITGEFIWVIHNWLEMAAMDDHMPLNEDTHTYGGSLALGADIDLTGRSVHSHLWTEDNINFDGTFDGRGYTVSNVTATANKGLFRNLSANGVIKNMKLTNVTVNANGGGLVGNQNHGTLENIYVEGSIVADDMNENHILANFGCGLLSGQYYETAKVSNCIVKVTSIKDGLLLGSAFGKLRYGVSEDIFTNCFAIGAAGNTISHYDSNATQKYTKVDFTEGGTNVSFDSMDSLLTNETAAALAKIFGLITE